MRVTRKDPGLKPAASAESLTRLFWFGAVLLWDFFAFVGEGPVALDGLLGFARGLGDVVDAKVFEEVNAHLSGYCDVEVAVFVEVEGEDLSAYACCAVVGDGDAGEGGVGVEFVGVDDVGVVGAGVVRRSGRGSVCR